MTCINSCWIFKDKGISVSLVLYCRCFPYEKLFMYTLNANKMLIQVCIRRAFSGVNHECIHLPTLLDLFLI